MLNLYFGICAFVITISQGQVSSVSQPSVTGSFLNGFCEHCLYGPEFCDPHTYDCIFGCHPGYVAPTCERRCIIQDCKECISTDHSGVQCTRCHAGFYGPMCNNSCSRHCKGEDIGYDTCDFHGNCIYGCQDKYSGPRCDQVDCPFEKCVQCAKFGSVYCNTCTQGYYPDSSSHNQVCIPCSFNCLNETGCNPRTGDCTECKKPWLGSHCDKQCNIDYCDTCGLVQDRVICQKCELGLKPSSDQSSCVSCDSSHCRGQCDPGTGACPLGCQDNWFGEGQFCDKFCNIANCDFCGVNFYKEISCTQCSNGFFSSSGITCKNCPSHCAPDDSMTSMTCDMNTGHCLAGCTVGYYGDQCEYFCSDNCVNDSCSIEGYCDCKPGWYGQRCNRRCPIHCTNCESFKDGVCSSCEPGWFGVTCDHSCSDTCRKDDFSGFVYCDQDTGGCSRGCYPGFHGNQCQNSCNPNCFSNVCEQATGNCQGCTLAWYGDRCDKKCPSQCKVIDTLKRRCNIVTGICADGCYDGYHGDHCNKTCSNRCVQNMCDRYTGECSHGCKLGYSGDNCEIVCQQKCPNKCSPNCFNDNCDDLTKVCVDGCMRGWFGMDCMNICSKACINNLCDQLTGKCKDGCKPGYYGDNCDQTCSPYCADELCDRDTGDCTNKCKPTFYGYLCEKSCSVKCVNRSCDPDTGACNSCGLGKQGPACNQACTPGYYGINCELTCGYCKGSSPCYVEDGRCPTGCELGWKGLTCLQAMSVSEATQSHGLNQSLQIGIGCAVGVFVCFLIIVGVVCWYKRHYKPKPGKTEAPVVYTDGAATIQTQIAGGTTINESSRNSSMNETSQLLGDKYGGAQVQLLDLVTRGQYSSIYKGEVIQQRKRSECCVKLVQLKDVSDVKTVTKRLSQEADILSVCGSHLNITSLITTYQSTDMFYIALDNQAQSSLVDYLQTLQTNSSTTNLEPSYICQLLQFAIDTCCGLCHIHKMQVKHRALQAACVYITNTPIAKIGDFMWSERTVHTPRDGPTITYPLPEDYQPWLAPESLMRQEFSQETDVWGLGLLIWEMFTLGQRPYDGLDWEAHKQAVINGRRPAKPQLAHFTLYRVMKNCWRYDSEDRPTADQMLTQLLDFQGRFASAGSMIVEI